MIVCLSRFGYWTAL